MKSAATLFAFAAALALTACGERPQTMSAAAAKKADGQAWQITDNGYLAPGWTPGDQASWEAQLKKRAQSQNDFALTTK